MREILVVRFGSLGDVCLLGWTLSRLAPCAAAGRCRVTLVTKPAFADLAARFAGVDRVVPLPGQDLGALGELAHILRRESWDDILDAHGVLRSHLLLAMLGRRPTARIAKHTVARLRLLRGGAADPALARTMRDRFDALLAPVTNLAPCQAMPPLAGLADPAPGATALGLAPGAQWAAKRWPDDHFAAVVEAFRRRTPAPVRVFLGPRETWFADGPLATALAAAGGVEIYRDRPLTEVAAGLAGCRVVLCNDSGLMHLTEAVGTPVVALFGPTVRAFGYFPSLPASTVLQVDDLDCRPCSRNGKRECWRGDLACLQGIGAEPALAAVYARGPWPRHHEVGT
jgi:heptosyltransferase-2